MEKLLVAQYRSLGASGDLLHIPLPRNKIQPCYNSRRPQQFIINRTSQGDHRRDREPVSPKRNIYFSNRPRGSGKQRSRSNSESDAGPKRREAKPCGNTSRPISWTWQALQGAMEDLPALRGKHPPRAVDAVVPVHLPDRRVRRIRGFLVCVRVSDPQPHPVPGLCRTTLQFLRDENRLLQFCHLDWRVHWSVHGGPAVGFHRG